MDWDDFDTYVTSKGYEYYKTEDDDFAETKAYSYDQARNSKAVYFIAKSVYKKTFTKMVAFQTVKKTEYLAIKEQLKTVGFKYISSETSKGSQFFKLPKRRRYC